MNHANIDMAAEAAEWVKDHQGLLNPRAAGLTGSSNTHARLSPSDSKRWTRCTASIAFQEANAHRVKKDDSSSYSDEGTEAHEWAAKVLLKQCTIDEVPEKGMLGNDLRVHVASYVDHCLDLAGSDYEVEVEVPLFYQPEQKGTCDFAWVSEDLVVIRDYKHGAGVLVSSDENSQLAIYAYSLIKLYDGILDFHPGTMIDIGIFQPRHREAADQKPWIVSLPDLEKFCSQIEYRATQARVGADRVREKIKTKGVDVGPGEILEAAPGLVFHAEDGDSGSCRWCKCKGFCPKRLEAATADLDLPHTTVEDMLAEMPDLDKKESKEPVASRVASVAAKLGAEPLPDSYLVTLVRRRKAIESFLADASEYLEARLLDGEQIEGLKVVMGREGNRAWGNEEDADKWLKNQGLKEADRYDYKLKSPTKIEEVLKEKLSKVARTRNRFDELVSRSPARKVMALADDKRPAVSCDLDAMPDMGADDDFEV